MTTQEICTLVDEYFRKEDYQFPRNFEHRFDEESSAILYSLIRKRQPVNCLEIGTWHGGSSCIIMKALQKNKKPFRYCASEIDDGLRESTYAHVKEICGEGPRMVGDITKNLERIPIRLDFLMIDTDHDGETTKWIVKNIFPYVAKGALIVIHDWAVEDKDGVLIGKGDHGQGGWEETDYFMDLIRSGEWPFKKIFYTYKNAAWESMSQERETGFWEKV